MQTRLHREYENGYEIQAIRYGLACLKRAGITPHSIIECFANKIKRIALEIDMGSITTSQTPDDKEHPYLMAAEYFLEEILSYPILPEKYGIPIKLPKAYVAYLAVMEENGYNHGGISLTGGNAVSMLSESDEYMMAALIEGFDAHVRTVQKASPDEICILASKNPMGLSQLNPTLIPEAVWLQAIITNPAAITFLPDHYEHIDFLEMACNVKSNAMSRIEIQDPEYLPKLMAHSAEYSEKITALAKTQIGGLSGVCMTCGDQDFLEIASVNPEILRDKENIHRRSPEVCYQLIEIYKYDHDLHYTMTENMPISALEHALDNGILTIEEIPKERAKYFGKKYSAKIMQAGKDDDYDQIPF